MTCLVLVYLIISSLFPAIVAFINSKAAKKQALLITTTPLTSSLAYIVKNGR